MAVVRFPTVGGAANFSATGAGTPESPFVIALTTDSPTSSVQIPTASGVASFGVTGTGTVADPFVLCAVSS